MVKKAKKGAQIQVDEKKGHLFLGDRDLRLLMLRPIDLIEFNEFAGPNAEDIIIWVGKTIGKYFLENIYPEEDWSDVKMSVRKKVIQNSLGVFELLGYGVLNLFVKKEQIIFSVEDPLTSDEKENIMAKNLCFFYQGLFNGILEVLDIDADGQEIRCFLLGDEACVFQFDLLIDEFEDADVDKEADKPQISSFLSSL